MQFSNANRYSSPSRPVPVQNNTSTGATNQQASGQRGQGLVNLTREYIIAPIALRIMAEIVDFFVLMLIKMAGILLLMRFTGMGAMSISFNFLITEEAMEDDITVDDLQNMVIVAFLYRILACMYEALFISMQGATIGKQIFGLEVIVCQASFSSEQGNMHRVSVFPGGTPAFASCWIRSMIKNFSIAFLMPAFLTVFFYQHNRTSYDIVSNTIVVKRR